MQILRIQKRNSSTAGEIEVKIDRKLGGAKQRFEDLPNFNEVVRFATESFPNELHKAKILM